MKKLTGGKRRMMNDYVATVNNNKRFIKIINSERLLVNDLPVNYSLTKIGPYSFILKIENNIFEVTVTEIDSQRFGIMIDGHYFDTTVRTSLQERAYEVLNQKKKQVHHASIKAPMPGLVLKLKKQAGDSVEFGESIIILEAMKMENDIHSPSTGVINEIFVKEGDSVEKDTILLNIG
jgi:biotin carboxyl carrier protein